MVGACSTYGREQGYIQGLVGKREEEGPLGKPRRGLKDNTKMYLEQEWGHGLGLAHYRQRWRTLFNVVMNFWVL
jgi:hypothetical protein